MSIDIKETLAGGFGALCCAYSGNPFDVVKIRLQTQSSVSRGLAYSGPLDCLTRIIKEEGVLALWKGVTPALSSALVENSVLFSMNGLLKRLYMSAIGDKNDDMSRPLSTVESAMLGGAGGFFSSTSITPLEVVKCRTQVEVGKSTSPFTKLVNIIAELGPRGMFRGLSATICRDVPFTFLFFGGYEGCSYLLSKSQSAIVCGVESLSNGTEEGGKLNPFGIYLAGGSAGAFAWGVAFPMDCVKSYMQTRQDPSSVQGSVTLRQAIHHIYNSRGGIQGFYRGWSAAVLRAFPANAGLFLGYEMALELQGCKQ